MFFVRPELVTGSVEASLGGSNWVETIAARASSLSLRRRS